MADNRYEREIDELLQRLEGEHRAPLPFRRRASPWANAWRRIQDALVVQSAVERLMALAVVLLLATIVLGLMAPRFVAPLAALTLGCFVLALGLSVWQGATGHSAHPPPQSHPHYSTQRHVDWDRAVWRLRRWFGRFRR
jgi:hypothetical protein